MAGRRDPNNGFVDSSETGTAGVEPQDRGNRVTNRDSNTTESPTPRARFAGQPITASDDQIRLFLEDLSVPTLMLSLVHMTGDASILEWEPRPRGCFLNEVQGFMSEDEQAEIRARALKIIRAYRDNGSSLPQQPDPALIHRMMNFLVVDSVPDEYVEMMLEELELDGRDHRKVDMAAAPETLARLPVVVIGGGMSGILAGIRLKEAAIPFTIIEKNPGPGGTWYENRYPGCRVDVGNHFYCYSFEPNNEWTEFFAQHDELRRYFDGCVAKYGLIEHTRYQTEVVSARYNETLGSWTIAVRDLHGTTSTLHARAVISATGQLSRPKLPEIEGIDNFSGDLVHSAAWPENLNLTGKRVAVIGSGASALQLVPAIADQVEQLTVYQRSAPWMFSNPNYHAKVGDGVKWALEHLPFYGRWYRFLLFWPGCDGGLPAMRVDPNWPDQSISVSELNDATRQVFSDYIASQVDHDPELVDKVIPDYVCLGKRTLQDNGNWLRALTRQDVELVTEPITRIADHGIVTADQTRHFDVIVCATGFEANKYLWPMEILGREQASLREQWGDDPVAYLGITVPNFPNFFIMYGPGTNLASGGSMILHAECQMRYISGLLKRMSNENLRSIEVHQDVCDEYNERLQAELEMTVWTHHSIKNSWYKNSAGKVRILSPWRLVDYWAWTKAPDPNDFVVETF